MENQFIKNAVLDELTEKLDALVEALDYTEKANGNFNTGFIAAIRKTKHHIKAIRGRSNASYTNRS